MLLLMPTLIRYLGIIVAAMVCCLKVGHMQAADVVIVSPSKQAVQALTQKAEQLFSEGKLLSKEQVNQQLTRNRCQLVLPKPSAVKLTAREVWKQANSAYVRVGWQYLCGKCDKWHQSMAGGYFITSDGVVVSCHHVVEPNPEHHDGYLVVATEDGMVYPVEAILAADAVRDVCILKVTVPEPVVALPLNADVYPGDSNWCYSHPSKHPGYFSEGIINRFFQSRGKYKGTRMEVSTDWAPGSSGAALLDEYGNAIGHVSTINTSGSAPSSEEGHTHPYETYIVFNDAVPAAAVLSLVDPLPESKEDLETSN